MKTNQDLKRDVERELLWEPSLNAARISVTANGGVSPTGLKAKIEQALKCSAAVDASHTKVDATGRTVTLNGTVGSWAEQGEAERVSWAAPGVNQVEDLITIT